MADVLQTGEYLVTLGDSLATSLDHGTTGTGTFLGLKYNWTPKHGFIGSKGRLRKCKGSIIITYDEGDNHYIYTGQRQLETENATSDLVLVYDEQASVYVLEKLATSLEMNLKSATNKSDEEILRLPQLKKQKTGDVQQPSSNGFQVIGETFDNDEQDDQSADPANPYDYRHFLAEAREVLEQTSGATPAGGLTPFGGSGFLSPAAGARNTLVSTTPQFGPTEIDSKRRDPLPKESNGRKFYGKSKGRQQNQRTDTSGKSKVTKRAAPLSAEKVVSSSDEDDDRDVRTAQKWDSSPNAATGRIQQSDPSNRYNRDTDETNHDTVNGEDDKSDNEIESVNPYFRFVDDEEENVKAGMEIEMEPDQDVDEMLLDEPERKSSPLPRIAINSSIRPTSSPESWPEASKKQKQRTEENLKLASPSAPARVSTAKAAPSRSAATSSDKPAKTGARKSATRKPVTSASTSTSAWKRKKSEQLRQDSLDDDDGLGAMLEAALEREQEEEQKREGSAGGLGLVLDGVEEEERQKERQGNGDVDGEESEISEEE